MVDDEFDSTIPAVRHVGGWWMGNSSQTKLPDESVELN